MDSELTLEKAKRLVRQQEAVQGQQVILSKPDGELFSKLSHHRSHSSDQQIAEACTFLSLSTVDKSAPTVEKDLTQKQSCPAREMPCHKCKKNVITAQFFCSKAVATLSEEPPEDNGSLDTISETRGTSWTAAI